MRACERCFCGETWIANASPPDASPGECDFGHGYAHRTWPTTAWVDSLNRLLALYEDGAGLGEGESLTVQLQQDWAILSLDDGGVRRFLESAIEGGHALLVPGLRVRLRGSDGDAPGDHLSSWLEFSEEIRTRNRYFPTTVPDRAILEEVLRASVEQIHEDVALYRARVLDSGAAIPLPPEMGAPPAGRATGGRANPVGIPYLYVSFGIETCICESRPASQSLVVVGRFQPEKPLAVLNLADIDAPDFFGVEEIEAVNLQVQRARSHRFLTVLAGELSKPLRSSDQPTEYIPTQYLCEMAKFLGMDGVLYGSSLQAGGRNLVLFDVTSAECTEIVQVVQVTAMRPEWRVLPPRA